MTDYQKNIERGLAEISRRESILISSMGLILPYGLLVMWPASVYLEQYLNIFLLPPIIFYLKVFLWLLKTPCPRCGKSIGDFNKIKSRKCASCGLDILAPKWFNKKVTFKKIEYIPGLKEESK